MVLNQSFFDDVLETDRINLMRMNFSMIVRHFWSKLPFPEAVLPQKRDCVGLKSILKANMM